MLDHHPGRSLRVWVFFWLIGLSIASGALAQALAPQREYEPVVVPGSLFEDWKNVADINNIGLFVYDGSTFVPIPFQIDKRRLINLRYNLNTPGLPLGNTNVCEYGYFPELTPSGQDNFASNLLQFPDEIVFMLRDAGTLAPNATVWYEAQSGDVVSDTRYDIVLRDTITGANRYVYAYLWTGGVVDKIASICLARSGALTRAR